MHLQEVKNKDIEGPGVRHHGTSPEIECPFPDKSDLEWTAGANIVAVCCNTAKMSQLAHYQYIPEMRINEMLTVSVPSFASKYHNLG